MVTSFPVLERSYRRKWTRQRRNNRRPEVSQKCGHHHKGGGTVAHILASCHSLCSADKRFIIGPMALLGFYFLPPANDVAGR